MVSSRGREEYYTRVTLLIIMAWQTNLMLIAEGKDCSRASSNKNGFHTLYM